MSVDNTALLFFLFLNEKLDRKIINRFFFRMVEIAGTDENMCLSSLQVAFVVFEMH